MSGRAPGNDQVSRQELVRYNISSLQKVRSENLGSLTHSGGAMESDRQIILTLQKSLEAEKLRNLNLSAELDLQRNMSLGSGGATLTGKHEDRGFYSSAPGKSRSLS